MGDIRAALQKCCSNMGQRYVPMRIARAMIAPFEAPRDCSDVDIVELWIASPDRGEYMSGDVGVGRRVEDFDWHGIAPHHWTLWLCLYSSDWGRKLYFGHE